MSKFNKIKFLNDLHNAFKNNKRSYPKTNSKQISAGDMRDVDNVFAIDWTLLSLSVLEESFSFLSFLTASNFKYYLPGIIKVSVENNEPDLISVCFVIDMIDRTPVIEYWDDHFIERWLHLNYDEYSVIKEWIYWLSETSQAFDDLTLIRCLTTIDLLISETFPKTNPLSRK